MTRISLIVRAIREYAERGELRVGATGVIEHRGDVIADDDARQVVDLLDEGVLVQDGALIVPAFEPDLDEVLARYPVEVAVWSRQVSQ